uniref:Uncharacterized protein n=1 Tax=Tanacetum cinerariifolium TaxID=118510 RepID=A0A699L3K0_TANCI|nr:hypothetical protein [Tanacetum cinerariifolium]
MVKLSFDLNVRKDCSDTNEAAQNGGNPKSVTFEIHHYGCFTLTPSRSYVGRQVSSVNVVDIEEFCLHNLKDMVVKLDNKIILVYVEYGISNVDSSIFVIPKKEVTIAVENHLRKPPIEIDSSPDVNRNLTPMCHRNLKKEWEQASYKALSIGEVMKILSKKHPASYVERLIVVKSVDHIDGLDEILGDYANTREEITRKQMIVHVEVEVDADNESKEESDTKENETNGIDSEDLDYDPKHDEVFDDDEHIVKDVSVSMNNFNFIPYLKHGLSIGGVEVQDHNLDIVDYHSFGNDLDGGIDSERRIQLRELKRIGKQKNKGPNKYYFYLGQQFATKEIMT